MAGLRGVTNHYSLHAGSRSDFQILAHPEFRHGKEGTKYGVPGHFDVQRCASRPARSKQRDIMMASMRSGTERLLGPREFGMSLRDRAAARTAGTLTRSCSLPAAGGRSPGASWRSVAVRLEAERSFAEEQPPSYTGARGDGTVGRFRYVPPPDCVAIMQNWNAAAASGTKYAR
uniref:Uncharacterized protein n=1 Tax=Alexandrium catenella TaxID=2925 RepID=A0A7S1QK67_ALECA|mmetsp:Transcript_33863/g.91658  ORF Transcript_33863/g.91658 Transcript_33863/m.91658 type:complete len:174 (+) Transcript_33863:124-645(+)